MTTKETTRKKLSRVATITASLVAPIILFEYSLKTLRFPTTGIKRYARLREHAPNSHLVNSPYTSATSDKNSSECTSLPPGEFHIYTDKNGFILSDHSKKYKPSENLDYRKVLFLGGSTTELALMDEKERFPSLIEQRLNSDNPTQNSRFISLNSGNSGNTSAHSNLILLAKGIEEKPEIAVMMHAVNDLTVLLRSGGYNDQDSDRGLVEEASLRQAALLILRSILPYTTDNIIKPLSIVVPSILQNKRGEFHDNAYQKKVKSLKAEKYINQFRSSLITFISLSRAHGINPVLMTQANRIGDHEFAKDCLDPRNAYGISTEEYVNLYQSFNNAIRETAGRYKVPIVDLDKAVPKNKEYIFDSVHLTSKGSLAAADAMTNIIKTLTVQTVLPRPKEAHQTSVTQHIRHKPSNQRTSSG